MNSIVRAAAVVIMAWADLALTKLVVAPLATMPLTAPLLLELGVGHVACAAFAAAAVAGMAPKFLRHRVVQVGLFSFVLGIFVPVVGALGVMLVLGAGFRERRPTLAKPWLSVDAQEELDERLRKSARGRKRRVLPSEIREALRVRTPATAARRFEAVLATRRLSAKAAVPLLKAALSDPSDEIRLYAFSRLEHMRDELEKRIDQISKALDNAVEEEVPRLHLRLAECYWELGYAGLAEGAVLDHALESARSHAVRACELFPGHASAEFFLGRVLVRLRDATRAEAAFERARTAGYPETKVLPYLAECAFYRGDYEHVGRHLADLDSSTDGAFFRPVIALWKESNPVAAEPRR